jgi:hypothetical protein
MGGIANRSDYVSGDGCFAPGLSFSSASTYYSEEIRRLASRVFTRFRQEEGRADAP